MEELNAKVLALVERELKKNPDLQSTDLQAKAVKIDKSVGGLSGRQFHARYALQVRRKLSGSTHPRAGAGRKSRRLAKGSNPVRELVADSYERKRARLETAIDRAFERAIQADSIGRINKLLSALDRHAKELERA